MTDFRQRLGAQLARFSNLVRRVAVLASGGESWQLEGYEDDEGNVETTDAEPFLGPGIYRPTSKAHAIVVNLDSDHSVVVALDDAEMRRAVEAALNPGSGERVDFAPSGAVMYWKDDGTVEIRDKGGEAKRLATYDDLYALMLKFLAWQPTGTLADTTSLKTLLTALIGSSGPSPSGAETWPEGTDKLRGQ